MRIPVWPILDDAKRNAMATSLLASFTKRLRSTCNAHGVSCSRWSGASPSSANILTVGTKPKETLLYIKCRTDLPGFWGLTKNRLSELNASGKPWYAVLIVGTPEVGYVASQDDVYGRTSSGSWTLAADGDFKVNENNDLEGISRFGSFSSFLGLVFPSLSTRLK